MPNVHPLVHPETSPTHAPEKALVIRVPATSANLGPGFDSLGVAVNRYLTVKATRSTKWEVDHLFGPGIPSDEHNLIVKTALGAAPDLPPHRLVVSAEIPLARGLGSSSAAIVAGLALAYGLTHPANVDAGGNLVFDKQALCDQACAAEGHPDNAAPAVFGQLVASFMDPVTKHVTAVPAAFPDLALVAYVPATKLLTSESRAALPATFAFKDAVAASAVGNALVAALLTNNREAIGRLVEQDRFHEPARAHLVPHLAWVRAKADAAGALGTYLSGAGPTVMTLVEPTKAARVVAALTDDPSLPGQVWSLLVDPTGVTGHFEEA